MRRIIKYNGFFIIPQKELFTEIYDIEDVDDNYIGTVYSMESAHLVIDKLNNKEMVA